MIRKITITEEKKENGLMAQFDVYINLNLSKF